MNGHSMLMLMLTVLEDRGGTRFLAMQQALSGVHPLYLFPTVVYVAMIRIHQAQIFFA